MNISEYASDLLWRAKDQAATGSGGVSQQEIDWAVAELQADIDVSTKENLIHILGYATYRKYKPVLTPFLAGPNVDLACTALWVLCRYWDLTDEYIEQLRNFIIGVPWDVDGKCRSTAMNLAEIYMTENFGRQPASRLHPRLLSSLIEVCENRSVNVAVDDQDQACRALDHLLGYPNLSVRSLIGLARRITNTL